MNWRIGSKVPLNVYAGDRPVCQCHSKDDAVTIVDSVNSSNIIAERDRFIRIIKGTSWGYELNQDVADEMIKLVLTGEESEWYKYV